MPGPLLQPEASKRVGFAPPDVMNKIFKRALGMTPRAYRQQVLGESSTSAGRSPA